MILLNGYALTDTWTFKLMFEILISQLLDNFSELRY